MKQKAIGPMRHRSIGATMPTVCDICGKGRGGGDVQRISHRKCSEERAAFYRSQENGKK